MAVVTPLIPKKPATRPRLRTVVIAGGFGVLGTAVARVAQASSARVVLIDRGASPASLDPAMFAMPDTDLSAYGKALRAFAEVGEALGPIDALLNVAGAFEWCQVADSDNDLWLHLYCANVLATVNACRASLPWLRPGASIVNVAAAAARRGSRGMAAYAASKAGVLRLTESLAEELAPSEIRVNSVSPTILDTPRNRASMPEADFTSWVDPEALARAMLSLASDATAAVSGADVLVGGSAGY